MKRKPHIFMCEGRWWIRYYGRERKGWSPLASTANFHSVCMYAKAATLKEGYD